MPAPRPVLNPPNPFESAHVEWDGPAPEVALEVFEEEARSILTENDSPDVGFRFSVNPYRGCFHGCTYCYARPTHQYLGFGAGTDFDRKIVVKINAALLLAKRLKSPRWGGDAIAFSGNTDCYQPLEASYALTRSCLEVCLAHANPVGIITKGTVIRRDVALLSELHQRAACRVSISLAFSDDDMRRHFDPYAPPVEARFETMRRLADAGIPVGIGISPIIPGVNDSMIPELLERAREAGASHAFMTLVRLSPEVEQYFDVRLEELLPQRARKVKSTLLSLRNGRARDARFGARMRGEGPRWDVIQQLFDQHVRRLGYPAASDAGLVGEGLAIEELGPTPARVARGQLDLFGVRSTEPQKQVKSGGSGPST